MLRVLNIIEGTSVDGPGLRTSVYLAGCQHFCPGCHNPESWDFGGGESRSVEQIMEVIRRNRFPVTLSGGDPLYQAEKLVPLCQAIQTYFAENPELRKGNDPVWLYTGFRWEDIRDKQPYRDLLQYVDVLVDGPFVENEKPIGPALRFRGSKNQRFIDLRTGQERIYE